MVRFFIVCAIGCVCLVWGDQAASFIPNGFFENQDEVEFEVRPQPPKSRTLRPGFTISTQDSGERSCLGDPENASLEIMKETDQADAGVDIRCLEMDKRGAPPQKPLWKRWPDLKCEKTDESHLFIETSPESTSASQDLTAKLPSGRLCPIENWGGVWCEAVFLIWQSKMWGLEFAEKSMNPADPASTSIELVEKVFVPDFAWRPGFKFDLGYDFAFDGWDLDSRWTYYRGESTHLKKHIASQISPQGLGVVPLWFYPFYTVLSPNQIRFFHGRMSWRHYFNSIDLEIGRLSALSKQLPMHLFAGLKGAWMHQYYRIEYEQGTTIDAILPGTPGTVPFSLLESTITFKNKTWGAGPRVGFDSKWKLRWGISLLANGALSLLYSKIETNRGQNDLNLNTSTSTVTPFHMHLQTSSHQLKPVVEGKLGLDWETCICRRSMIGFSIAYELQYWWAQNELRRNYSHVEPGGMFPERGDLQMHGLTATAAYHY